MKLSVSLSDADVAFLDDYARAHGIRSRSGVLHEARTMRPHGRGVVTIALLSSNTERVYAFQVLRAMAAAVVTDIGGRLSHSSIAARGYGIPAMLGTGVATRRIRIGELLRIDGDAGTVRLLDEAQWRSGGSVASAVGRGPGHRDRRGAPCHRARTRPCGSWSPGRLRVTGSTEGALRCG